MRVKRPAAALGLALVAHAASRALASEELSTAVTPRVPLSQQAAVWALTEAEYRDYQTLMAGQRGLWSPGLDPITALGVSTDSAEERRRYAELYVRTEYQRTRRELAFQVAVNDAWRRLYPGTPRLQAAHVAGANSAGRVAVIVRLGSPAGEALLAERFPGWLSAGAGVVDVHVAGTAGDDARLRTWAGGVPGLDQALRQGRATLNHGDQFRGELALPAIYRRDGAGQWARIE
jgi:integrating conjugative element protein (TIGR03759 family)